MVAYCRLGVSCRREWHRESRVLKLLDDAIDTEAVGENEWMAV